MDRKVYPHIDGLAKLAVTSLLTHGDYCSFCTKPSMCTLKYTNMPKNMVTFIHDPWKQYNIAYSNIHCRFVLMPNPCQSKGFCHPRWCLSPQWIPLVGLINDLGECKINCTFQDDTVTYSLIDDAIAMQLFIFCYLYYDVGYIISNMGKLKFSQILIHLP